jgi:hypothetical protein
VLKAIGYSTAGLLIIALLLLLVIGHRREIDGGNPLPGVVQFGVFLMGLIAFITLAVNNIDIQAKLIVWIFAMRFLMDFMSGVSYFVNQGISESQYRGLKEFNFEAPLTRLIWIASILCISPRACSSSPRARATRVS